MKRNTQEEDDVQLNIRKGLALRNLFNDEQIRVLIEGNVCGIIDQFKKFAVNAVLWIKGRKERRTPMNAVLAAHAFLILNSVDRAKEKIILKTIELIQKLVTSLDIQSNQVNEMSNNFGEKIASSREDYNEMLQTYISFLETANLLNDTWIGTGLNWLSNGSISEAIQKAESGQYTLQNTQDVVEDIHIFLQDLDNRTQTMLTLMKSLEGVAQNAQLISNIMLNGMQIISATVLAYQVFYAYGLYHAKNNDTIEQKAMMKYVNTGIWIGVITLIAFFAKVNPALQGRGDQITTYLQEMIDTISVYE